MSAGHQLETLLLPPPNPTPDSSRLAVLLHPWSWLGGRMNDPVLASLVQPLHEENYHVLLFNSRGVGQSTGRATWTGNGESDDLQELVRKTISERLSGVQRLLVVGKHCYSHGSMIASRLPLQTNVTTSHILLSYPLSYRPFLSLFSSSAYQTALSALVRNPQSDVLIVHGDSDDFTGISKYNAWAATLQAEAKGKLRVEVVPEAGHFWAGASMDRLEDVVKQWLRRTTA
ncbi:alpha/beta-hydrolase [Exidia glandulosa HHB12029]|uniref:Alpha/beta-hydrolase n=1 Tax=Exidia glandulosa HHB12029 TaxID=1314781 RepID=A0A165GIJ8_EXIGL|nr:alpha/beta-hydrolase [Exidia glandulosa HHB12029]